MTAGRGRICGIYVPHMVPLTDRGEINERELRLYIDWMIDRGVHGLYPNGSTSEFTRFTPQERRRIIEIVMDQTAGRVPVLAGAAEAAQLAIQEAAGRTGEFSRQGLKQAADDYTQWFFSRLKSVEQAAGEREYLCAGRFTIADICVGYALYLADTLGLRGGFKPNTEAYYKRLSERPAFQRAIAL